jgi:hypothetical protein
MCASFASSTVLRRPDEEGRGFGLAPIRVEGLGMKRRRSRLRHQEADPAARDARERVRAERERFYAQRRGEIEPEPKPVEATPVETAPATAPFSADVPAEWRELHWKKRVAIAKQLYPGFQFVNGNDADAAIRRYLGSEE